MTTDLLSEHKSCNISQKNNFCWIRQIEVRLTSKLTKKRIVFGGDQANQLNIVVKGNKYLSALKDKKQGDIVIVQVVNNGKTFNRQVKLRNDVKSGNLTDIYS